MASTSVPVPPIYGALFFSVVMCTAFYGIACMQTFYYFMHYAKDPLHMKLFVVTLWMLNTVHEALAISGAYKFILAAIVSEGQFFVDGLPELTLQLMLFTGLVGIPTQGFFIHRIYVFSRNSIVVPLLWIPLAVYQLVADLIYVVEAGRLEGSWRTFAQSVVLSDHFFSSIYVSCSAIAAGVDIFIAIFMTFLLIRERTSPPVLKTTARLLHTLIVFSVNTGTWTAIFAVLAAVLMRVFPTNLIYTVFGISLCSVYFNTLLANLNVRMYLRVQSEAGMTLPSTIGTFESSVPKSCHAEGGIFDPNHSGL